MNTVSNEQMKHWSVWAGDLDFGIIDAVNELDAIAGATAMAGYANFSEACGVLGISEEKYISGFCVRQERKLYDVKSASGEIFEVVDAVSIEDAIQQANPPRDFGGSFCVVPVDKRGADTVSIFRGYAGNTAFVEWKTFNSSADAESYLREQGYEPSLCGRHWVAGDDWVDVTGEQRPIYKIA